MGSHLNLEQFVHEYPQNWGFAFSFHSDPTRIIETTEDIVLWARRVASTYVNCNDLRMTLEIMERLKILNFVARSRELRFQKRPTMRLQWLLHTVAQRFNDVVWFCKESHGQHQNLLSNGWSRDVQVSREHVIATLISTFWRG